MYHRILIDFNGSNAVDQILMRLFQTHIKLNMTDVSYVKYTSEILIKIGINLYSYYYITEILFREFILLKTSKF